MISATLYSDPACPWAYSESPALRVIEWRYGDQLDWRLVVIGLTEDASQYVARGYTPLRGALGQLRFRRRYGMPFAPAPEGARERHRARLPGDRRGQAAEPGQRVGRRSARSSSPTSPRRCCSTTTSSCARCSRGVPGDRRRAAIVACSTRPR